MPTLQYPNNPNTDTAFVVQDDGTKNRALMTAPQDTSTLELPSNPNSTKGYVTIDGKKQRVVLTADISGGGSGGDQHNLGWYATESALTTAHPTATDGDWAIIGSTDTVWVWDTDTTAWKDTGAAGIELPSQTGNAGKFLTTNGTSASWSTSIDQTITFTGAGGNYIYELRQKNGDLNLYLDNVKHTRFTIGGLGPGQDNHWGLGSQGARWATVHTCKLRNNNASGQQYDIKVPSVGGSLALQIATLPTAGSTYEGTIYQYTGATDSTYTNGHFYKCVSDGQTPATYSWEEISFGGGLPSQTGNAGKFLVTDGTSASWSNEIKSTDANASAILTLKSQNNDYAQFYKRNSTTTNLFGVAVYKNNTYLSGIDFSNTSVTISHNNVGFYFSGTDKSFYSNKTGISLGRSSKIWENVYTQKINNGADIIVPSVGGELAVKQVNTTITLTSAGWSSNTQTVSVTGMTATGLVFVSPVPTDQSAYTSAGVLCTAQAAGALTFTCTSVPSGNISVSVVML